MSVFKAIAMIKRKKGTTMEQFMDYYENYHAPLAMKYVPNLKRYVRHYIRPYGNNVYEKVEAPYDVITELWFDDREDFEKGMAYLSDEKTAAIIAEDEEKAFDRSSIIFMTMEDRETEINYDFDEKTYR